MNFYKKCTAKPFHLLAIDTTIASDNPLRFKKNLLVRIEKLIMATDDKIRDKNYNMILTKKQQKDQHNHQVKLRNINILKVKKYYLLIEAK